MPMAERTAEVTWTGTLAKGSGVLTLHSGATGELPVTWASRTERSDGKTSPEELIAAAHASCFSMAFSSDLTEAGTPPERLEVSATCTLDKTDAGLRVTAVALRVRGVVAGIDAAGFRAAAEAAKDGCPISNLLKGNAQLSVEAELA
jgi:osmotically inducible protein OsmC